LDIADLTPQIVVHVEPLGEVQMEAFSGAFESWINAGQVAARWTDGDAFVRDLAAQQIRSHPGGERIAPEVLTPLTQQQLAGIANALLIASGNTLRPRYVATLASKSRNIRKRRADEAYDMAARADETSSEQLLRILSDWAQDVADRRTIVLAKAIAPDSAMGTKIFAENKGAIAWAMETYDRMAKIGAIQPSTMSSLKIAGALESSRIAQLISAAKLPGFLSPSFEVASRMRDLVSASNSLASISKPAWAEVMKTTELYPLIAPQLQSAITKDITRWATLLDTSATAKIMAASAMQLAPSLLRDQRMFADVVNREFHLGLPGGMLAAMSMVTATPDWGFAKTASIFPLGYQMAATLGLEGLASRGAVADLLRYYDDAAGPEAPVFGSATEVSHLIDQTELSDAEAVAFLERLWTFVSRLLTATKDEVQRAGLIAVLSLIVSVVSASFTLEEALAKNSAPPQSGHAGVVVTVDQVRREIDAHRPPESNPENRLRYVRTPAPIRSEPQKDGIIIRVAYAGDTLRIVDDRGEWAMVEIYDFHAEHMVRGWISRRRLRATPQS
jgi:hypothetical protein